MSLSIGWSLAGPPIETDGWKAAWSVVWPKIRRTSHRVQRPPEHVADGPSGNHDPKRISMSGGERVVSAPRRRSQPRKP
jgi:hypothetical protein